MSELTETVRKMLSQAQVFARDTPFEAVARARQAVGLVDGALRSGGEGDPAALDNLKRLAAGRLARYEAQLSRWVDASRDRGEAYTEREREVMAMPLRARA